MGTDTQKTIEETLMAALIPPGLFKNQAKEVMTKRKAENEPMKGRWNELANSYPKPLMNVLSLRAPQTTVDWIDESQHWARPMFADGLPVPTRDDTVQPANAGIKNQL